MAYISTADRRHSFVATPSKPEPRPRRERGLFGRLFDAMAEGRRHAADREIAAYLRDNGKLLTDETEREIERILASRARF